MKILSLHREVIVYLQERNLTKKFNKQCVLFQKNPFHPSLGTELLEPRNLRIWSFRVDRKYRAIFIFLEKDVVEILDVNNHYQ